MILFTKMHGLGNDFVVINGLVQSVALSSFEIKELADRHCGIGFDQLLIINRSNLADFSCQIFNSDGSEAKQCGNGLRCVARFIAEEKLFSQPEFSIETKSGIHQVKLHDEQVTVNMGIPHFQKDFALTFEGISYPLNNVGIGNPHSILTVSSFDDLPFENLGQFISTHPHFPDGTNVGFMQIIHAESIHLRTYERGAGLTLACGSNACAAAVVGMQHHQLNSHVQVKLPLGYLTVHWAGLDQPIFLTGPAQRIFDGKF